MVPMCNKCCDKILTKQVGKDGYPFWVLTGCKACDIIKSYADALIHCPLIKEGK